MNPRGPQRREEDMSREWNRWAALVILHRGKLIALLTALASIITWIMTTAGYRYTGPPQDIKRIEKHIIVLDSASSRHDRDLQWVRNKLVFIVYMQCVQNHQKDQYAFDTCAKNQEEPR